MTTPVIDLLMMQSDSPLPTSTATTLIITTTTSLPPPSQPQQSTTNSILVSCIGELEQHIADLIQNNLALEEMLDKQRTRLYNLENLNIPHKVSQAVDEIVTDAVDWEEARKKKRKKHAAPRTLSRSLPSLPPPPPPLAGASGAPGNKALSSSKHAASTHQSMTWTTSNTRFDSTGFMAAQELSPTNSLMQDDSIPEEQVHLSDDEDSRNDHLPKAYSRQDWASALVSTYETPAENSLLEKTGDMATFMKCLISRCHSPSIPNGGVSQDAHSSGHVIIQLQFFFNKDLEYLRYGSKGSNPALSISKMKAASYLDFGLELLVPEQMWIDDMCTYDISAKYGISHWWFNRQKFYIDKHDSPSRRKDVRTHMRILKHTIAEKDFKNLYPSKFKDLNLLLLQGHLDHLPSSDKRMLSTAVKLWTRNLVIRHQVEDFQLGIESYQTQLNLTKPGWDATGYEFKHDYTIIESP
ncbi:hypothetical protein Tco_1060681 [Tanacetum coccineum]